MSSNGHRSHARLLSLTIENFRGVREPVTFDLDASVVLMWGPNGTGKTTFFDALLWLLQGSLPRLAAHTLRRNEDYVVNSYRPSSPAVVTALANLNDQVFEITRRGFAKENSLEIRAIAPTETARSELDLEQLLLGSPSLSLEEVIATSGLLQQDDLRLLLRDKPDQRYRQLLRLLGLEVLEQFERYVRARQKEARAVARESLASLDKQRSRVSDLTEEADTLVALIERSSAEQSVGPDLADLSRSLEALDVRIEQPTTSGQWAALSAEASDVSRRMFSTIGSIETLGEEEPPAVDRLLTQDELDAATQMWQSASAAVQAILREREVVEHEADALNQLAQLAIPQLRHAEEDKAGHVACPVCRSSVPRARTIQDLTERAELGSALAAVDDRLRRARQEELDAQSNLSSLEDQWRAQVRQLEGHRRVERMAEDLLHEIESLASGPTIVIRPLQTLHVQRAAGSASSFLRGSAQGLVARLRAAQAEAIRLAKIADMGAAQLRAAEASMATVSQLPQVRARLETATAQLAESQREYERARRESAAATALAAAATDGIEQIFRERFQSLEPLMNDIYGRLDPHPTFTRLDFQIETYNGRGTATASVTDEDEDVRGNPLLIFSSAQANIVALSAFLALGWAAGDSGLPFVLMDDPLQSLDDVNVLGFSDLMRQVRRGRQVILSTHEERFARVLERKLHGRSLEESLIVHRFVGWGRQGPKFETRNLPHAPSVGPQVVNL